jgi:predicted nucleic acid-binding protein
MIILDTDIWIWWANNNPRLTQQHREWIQQYQSQGLGVSMISCWEVAKLVENNRLALSLAALTEAEARELIASSPMPFAAEDVEWILTQSKCWPLLLQILCRERLFTLEHGEMGDDWHQEGLQQMQPFTHLFEKFV